MIKRRFIPQNIPTPIKKLPTLWEDHYILAAIGIFVVVMFYLVVTGCHPPYC